MTSKEIIKRIIAHDAPPRFGYGFLNNSDIKNVRTRQLINLSYNPYDKWGKYPELEKLTGFRGETRRDQYGNIYGRFDGKTKGECIRGVIQDWDDYKFSFPNFDPNYREKLLEMKLLFGISIDENPILIYSLFLDFPIFSLYKKI